MTPSVPHCIRINRQPFYFPAKLQGEVVTCVAIDRDGTVNA
ncbi:hypothetical protein [Andreprevotia chitinilytica]|nr:hypothetical protein [Andreprevotia chitinilytica]